MSAEVLDERQVYRCENPACSLGAVGEPGHFTGGATRLGIHVLTGTPEEHLTEGDHFGEGICPNCGKAGTAADYTHQVVRGADEKRKGGSDA